MADNIDQHRERGQLATHPTHIPASGWWDIVRRIANRVGDENMTILAAGVAFYAMLALFPALGAIVTLYALVSDPADVQTHFNSVAGILPADVVKIIDAQLSAIAAKADQRLGIGLLIGLLVAVWSAHRGIVALVAAITVAYRERETRGFIKLNAITYLLTFGAVLMVVSAMVVMIGVPAVLNFLPVSALVEMLTRVVSWVMFFLLVVIGLSLLYRFGPPRRTAKWRWLSPGALAATVLWLLGSAGFSVYVGSFGNYNETYGALGAIMVLLLWFFLSGFTVLLGAAVNAEMELQTAKDTTQGSGRPMGQRGAFVADRVAKIPGRSGVPEHAAEPPG